MKKVIKNIAIGLISISTLVTINGCGGGGSSTSNEIIHNGVTYKTVKSPGTGRVWLDRNIGASRVCTLYNDTACYGDYFQWGRNADGHEDWSSGTTTTQATDIKDVGHSLFILSNNSKKGDWAYSVDPDGKKREKLWSATDGSSVCPKGFRVPTYLEFKAELDTNNIKKGEDAFNSVFKFSANGARNGENGNISQGDEGLYWTSYTEGDSSGFIEFDANGITIFATGRAYGLAVRCIKD